MFIDKNGQVRKPVVYLADFEMFLSTCEETVKYWKEVCDKYGLYLYLDGARLGSALTSKECDYEPSFLGHVLDAFYIGGTKNGMLFGEALVIVNKQLQKD